MKAILSKTKFKRSANMKIIEALRIATRQSHDALHSHPILAPLIRPDITVSDWQYAVLAFDLFYRKMESNRKVRLPEGLPDAPVLDWLRDDLIFIGAEPLDAELNAPVIHCEARLMGYLYLKQGSTLGGAVISKNINRLFKQEQRQRFFSGYGNETGTQWKKFINELEQRAILLSREEIIEMAQIAFSTVTMACDAALAVKSKSSPARLP